MDDVLPFLSAEDAAALGRLAAAEVGDRRLAFVTFATALDRDLRRYYRGGDLRGFPLREQDLREVDLTGADLRGADLRGAQLSSPVRTRWRSG